MNDALLAKIDLIKKNTVCKIVGHKAKYAESCPYTGVTYDYCGTCHHMVPREEVYD